MKQITQERQNEMNYWLNEMTPYIDAGKRCIWLTENKIPMHIGWASNEYDCSMIGLAELIVDDNRPIWGFGVVQGDFSNELTFDFDEDAEATFKKFAEKVKKEMEIDITTFVRVISGRIGGGIHLTMGYDGKVYDLSMTSARRNVNGAIKNLIELKKNKNQIVKPPSKHKSGNIYKAINGNGWEPKKLTIEQVNGLIKIARSFDELPDEAKKSRTSGLSLKDIYYGTDGKETGKYKYNGMDVITEYNNRHSIETTLELYGAYWAGGSGTHMCRPDDGNPAGSIRVFIDDNRCQNYGTGGFLKKADRQYSPFDIFCEKDFGGDYNSAIKMVSEQYNMREYINNKKIDWPKRKVDKKETKWALKYLLPVGELVIDFGEPKIGKSTWCYEIAKRIANGTDDFEQGDVLIVSTEVDLDILPFEHSKVVWNETFSLDRMYEIVDYVKEHPNLKMIVLDNLGTLCDIDENSKKDTKPIMLALQKLARVFGLIVILVHHTRKDSPKNGARIDKLRGSGALRSIPRHIITTLLNPDDPDSRIIGISETAYKLTSLRKRKSTFVFYSDGKMIPYEGNRTIDEMDRLNSNNSGVALCIEAIEKLLKMTGPIPFKQFEAYMSREHFSPLVYFDAIDKLKIDDKINVRTIRSTQMIKTVGVLWPEESMFEGNCKETILALMSANNGRMKRNEIHNNMYIKDRWSPATIDNKASELGVIKSKDGFWTLPDTSDGALA